MNRCKRRSAYRSFSIEKLERRSMLAADSVECSFATESTDLSDAVFHDEVFQKSPSDVCSLPNETSADSPNPFEAFPSDDTANSVPVSGETEPVTAPEEPFIGIDSGMENGQAPEMSFNLLVCPPVFEFETTGLIAVEPEVSVDPVLALEVTTGVSPFQFIYGDIFGSLALAEPCVHITSETAGLPTNRGLDADTSSAVYDGPTSSCGVGVQTDSGDADTVAAAVEFPAAGSTSDDKAPVVVASSGGASLSTASSAATAQAFASVAASFSQGMPYGQGGGDVQSGQPTVGGRRTARR